MLKLDTHFFKLGLHILGTTAGRKGVINLTPDTNIYVTKRGLNGKCKPNVIAMIFWCVRLFSVIISRNRRAYGKSVSKIKHVSLSCRRFFQNTFRSNKYIRRLTLKMCAETRSGLHVNYSVLLPDFNKIRMWNKTSVTPPPNRIYEQSLSKALVLLHV
jgi:hypothetical protein